MSAFATITAVISAITSAGKLLADNGGTNGVAKSLGWKMSSSSSSRRDLEVIDSVFFIRRYAFANNPIAISLNGRLEFIQGQGYVRHGLKGFVYKRNGVFKTDIPTIANHFLYDKETGYIIQSLVEYLKVKKLSNYLDLTTSRPDLAIIGCIEKLIEGGYIFVTPSLAFTKCEDILEYKLKRITDKRSWRGWLRYNSKDKVIREGYISPFFSAKGCPSSFKSLPDISSVVSNASLDSSEFIIISDYFNWIYNGNNLDYLLSLIPSKGLFNDDSSIKVYPPSWISDEFISSPFEEDMLPDVWRKLYEGTIWHNAGIRKYITDAEREKFFQGFSFVPTSFSPYLPANLMIAYYSRYFGNLSDLELNTLLSGSELKIEDIKQDTDSEKILNTISNNTDMNKIISWSASHWWVLALAVAAVCCLIYWKNNR